MQNFVDHSPRGNHLISLEQKQWLNTRSWIGIYVTAIEHLPGNIIHRGQKENTILL